MTVSWVPFLSRSCLPPLSTPLSSFTWSVLPTVSYMTFYGNKEGFIFSIYKLHYPTVCHEDSVIFQELCCPSCLFQNKLYSLWLLVWQLRMHGLLSLLSLCLLSLQCSMSQSPASPSFRLPLPHYHSTPISSCCHNNRRWRTELEWGDMCPELGYLWGEDA